jgi:hypothetical protein
MDDAEKTATLIRRNRTLLARAALARMAAGEAVALAEHALNMLNRQTTERMRRNAIRHRAVRNPDDARKG